MDEKKRWEGVTPTPRVIAELDFEETAVLAYLAWSAATNRPVRPADVAQIPDRNGHLLGLDDARQTVERLNRMKIVSVLGMRTSEPLSIFLGGFQPRQRPADRPAPSLQPFRQPARPPVRPAHGKARPARSGGVKQGPPPWIKRNVRIESDLAATPQTPDFVFTESEKLKAAQARVEGGAFKDRLVDAAKERLGILEGRIALYERWLEVEPGHPKLAALLQRKRNALPEMRFQVERAIVKERELKEEAS